MAWKPIPDYWPFVGFSADGLALQRPAMWTFVFFYMLSWRGHSANNGGCDDLRLCLCLDAQCLHYWASVLRTFLKSLNHTKLNFSEFLEWGMGPGYHHWIYKIPYTWALHSCFRCPNIMDNLSNCRSFHSSRESLMWQCDILKIVKKNDSQSLTYSAAYQHRHHDDRKRKTIPHGTASLMWM